MKNWTIKEAVETIRAGKDAEGIKEIAKYFPMFFLAVASNDMGMLASAMGSEKFTVRRVEQGFQALNAGEETEGTDEAVDVAEDNDADTDLSAMSTKELMKLCDKRGIKVPHYGKNKQFYLDALNNAGSAPAVEEADEAEDEAADEYEGKSAMDLYKLCKKRGIKVEAKKKANVYAEALRKADAEAAAAEDAAEDDDDWGDEDDAEEEKPAKKAPAAKGGKKAAGSKKVPAKKAEPAEDDGDDEWDI